MEKEFWCHVCSIQFLDEGGLVSHESTYEHLARKRRKENNDKVQSMPFDSENFMKQAFIIFEKYIASMQPPKPDPHAAEKQLFDQIVLALTMQYGPDKAVEGAMTVIRARRELDKETRELQ